MPRTAHIWAGAELKSQGYISDEDVQESKLRFALTPRTTRQGYLEALLNRAAGNFQPLDFYKAQKARGYQGVKFSIMRVL
jgi:hypothetical protein